ncbi:hypothetical protein M408DRAFT_330926 [Serendipita vermifera MAFF 305830]|uniref:Gag1-like clamp domain-containing protein n=1 Tax=Serendipita vermifera MAFF 305830 TaxID=933852 RepID=A0A0C3B324_SERVB|nr:hypothetical protein M408DRAFT_330926 [Serendipita vermifera MAFF 305830]
MRLFVCPCPPRTFIERLSYSSLASQSLNVPTNPEEPTTGPAYWEKKRAEWLAGTKKSTPQTEDDNGPGSRARARLEVLLAPHLAEEDDMVWNDTVGAIAKGLTRGDRLKKSLPLPIVIKILRGGWLRDGTWPRGMHVPEDKEGMGVPEPFRSQKSTNSAPN